VGDRDAIEPAQQRARHLPRFGGPGIRQRAFFGHQEKGIQVRIEAADTVEMRLGELDRGQFLGGDAPCRFGDGKHRRHQLCSAVKVSAGSASRGSGAFTRAIISRKITAPGRIALT
jgi:hypothetical protein